MGGGGGGPRRVEVDVVGRSGRPAGREDDIDGGSTAGNGCATPLGLVLWSVCCSTTGTAVFVIGDFSRTGSAAGRTVVAGAITGTDADAEAADLSGFRATDDGEELAGLFLMINFSARFNID